jgi:hypothetical protein
MARLGRAEILGRLRAIRSNFSIGLMAFGVYMDPTQRSALLRNRVIVLPGEIRVVGPGQSTYVTGLYYESKIVNAETGRADASGIEFAKSVLRHYLSDSLEELRNACRQTPAYPLLEGQPWYRFARLTRNALEHERRWRLRREDPAIFPVEWNGRRIDQTLEGQELRGDFFDWYAAIELGDAMEAFVATLPE